MIKGVYCSTINSLYLIDKDRVIVGERETFYIVNIDKCVIEKTIEYGTLFYVCCFLKLRDNRTILCGSYNTIFGLYDMNTEQCKITKNNINTFLNDLLLIDDNNTFLCSFDGTIKVWKY